MESLERRLRVANASSDRRRKFRVSGSAARAPGPGPPPARRARATDRAGGPGQRPGDSDPGATGRVTTWYPASALGLSLSTSEATGRAWLGVCPARTSESWHQTRLLGHSGHGRASRARALRTPRPDRPMPPARATAAPQAARRRWRPMSELRLGPHGLRWAPLGPRRPKWWSRCWGRRTGDGGVVGRAGGLGLPLRGRPAAAGAGHSVRVERIGRGPRAASRTESSRTPGRSGNARLAGPRRAVRGGSGRRARGRPAGPEPERALPHGLGLPGSELSRRRFGGACGL